MKEAPNPKPTRPSPNSVMAAVCPTSPIGVAVAAYSLRHSQMWSWDVRTLEILGTQKIRARIELLDMSPDGRYCGYFAEAWSKREFYVAISRPPYFQALWIRNAHECFWRTVYFSGGRQIRCEYMPVEAGGYAHLVKERTTQPCPFCLQEVELHYQTTEYCDVVRGRCSKAWYQTFDPNLIGPPQSVTNWVGVDAVGRKVTISGWGVYADGELVVDCAQTPFEAIEPLPWASKW